MQGAPVFSWLLLGFAMGLRHSLEADHLAAVASLSARAAGAARSGEGGGRLGHRACAHVCSPWRALGWRRRLGSRSRASRTSRSPRAAADLARGRPDPRREGRPTRVRPHEHSRRNRARPPALAAGRSASDPVTRAPARRRFRCAARCSSARCTGSAGSALIGSARPRRRSRGSGDRVRGVFASARRWGCSRYRPSISFPLRWPRVRAAASTRSRARRDRRHSIAIGIWISVQSLLPDRARASGLA